MKTFLLIASLILLAAPANASKARLSALGQDTSGSSLIKDGRNIFLNPSYVGQTGNTFNFEMGNTNTNAYGSGTNPYSEGGMTYDMGPGKLGVQLGRRTSINDAIADSTFLPPKNSLDVIYGTKGNKAMGFGLHYAAATDDALLGAYPQQNSSELEGSAGMTMDKLEVYAHLALVADSETKTSATVKNTFKGKSYQKVGFGYDIDSGSKVYGTLTNYKFETNVAGTVTVIKSMDIEVNYAHLKKPKTDVMMFYGAGLVLANGDYTVATTKTDLTETSIPVFLGLEVAATSWMDLRASAKQMVVLNSVEDTGDSTEHSPNTTTVGAGASLKFNNNLVVDTTLGASDAGEIDGNSLFANASMNYSF